MGKLTRWEDCNRAEEFGRLAERKGRQKGKKVTVENGKSHLQIRVAERDGRLKGKVAVPRHGEIKKGTKHAIIRTLVRLGLGALVFLATFAGVLYLLLSAFGPAV